MKWRINILALVGAFIGIIAIFSVWITYRLLIWSSGVNLLQILEMGPDILGAIYCVSFIIGTLIAFVSPMGAFFQIVGIIAFFLRFMEMTGGRILPLNIGPYLGVASAIILIVSIAKPIGLNYGSGSIGLKDRLLTFRKAPEPLPPPDKITQSPLSRESTPQKSSISEDEGLKIVLHCSQCGKPTDGGAFCKHCGAKLG